MPRMRTIDQAHAWLTETDPGTAITKTGLRRLVTSGQLPSVRVGSKYLIELGQLEEFMSGAVPVPIVAQGIRPVEL